MIQHIEKDQYTTFGKVVLSDGATGVMLSTEHYNELSALSTDEQIFGGVE
jgi:hypothetical protein